MCGFCLNCNLAKNYVSALEERYGRIEITGKNLIKWWKHAAVPWKFSKIMEYIDLTNQGVRTPTAYHTRLKLV